MSLVAAVLLWRHHARARPLAVVEGWTTLAATIAATAMDVMGPPATIVGVLGAITPLIWNWKAAAFVGPTHTGPFENR